MMMLSAPVLTGDCAVVGPYSISNGCMAYNEVINYTEDQQLLNAIVQERYGQTFGMLSVSSVAARVKFRGSVGAEFNAWGSDKFMDKLTPLSLGAAYEENPTISYVLVQGEAVLRSLVTPLRIEEQGVVLAHQVCCQTPPLPGKHQAAGPGADHSGRMMQQINSPPLRTGQVELIPTKLEKTQK